MSVALATKGRIAPTGSGSGGGVSQLIHDLAISVSDIGLDLVVVGSQLDLSVVAHGINITVDTQDIDVNVANIDEGITIT